LKLSHQLLTLISDGRICKRCSVNRTLFHIPNLIWSVCSRSVTRSELRTSDRTVFDANCAMHILT